MKCDGCDRPATVHNLVIVKGHPTEQHLCELCAQKAGLQTGAIPVAQLLLHGLKSQSAAIAAGEPVKGPVPAAPPTCPRCGLSYGQFRHQGLLGCGGCYEAFAEQLGPLLDRAHEGATHHTGKIPRRIVATATSPAAGGSPSAAPGSITIDPADLARREAALRKQLEQAVAAEQFERAACLRDELRKLAALGEPGGTG
ncbi:MAG: UvrB/UvrC motif-containing protein [Phycisphaerales bacterium]